ncbi:restriction endonuclease subunit S [Pseudomonas putida]|uniref:restriction endonuclease subunit S n=1 Tax=Pseudomonas putida TaxID=303 RepID=UPI00370A1CD7
MAVKPGYKPTAVGVIPEEWDIKTLGSLTSLLTNGFVGTATSAYVNGEDGVLYIQGYNVQENGFNFRGIKRVSKSFHARNQKSCLQSGDLLTIQTGDIGVTTVVPPELVGANCHALVISRLNKRVAEPSFYCQYFNSEQGRAAFKEIETGTTMKHLNCGDMKRLFLPLPPVEEQRSIATALSDVDALLGSLERLIAKKRDLKQASMQQLLTGQTRLPGFAGEWGVRLLGDIARIQRGASPRPIDSPVWFDQNSSIGWVRISDVTKSGMYLRETTQRLSPLGVQHSRPVARGRLIMSICATVGRPVITEIDVCIHDGFVVFDDLQADKLFIYYKLKWIEPDWSKHGQTGSQMNLNTGLIAGTEISLPPLAEQAAIAAVLSDMDAELAALEQRLAKTRTLKQGMMQDLLTGRTRLL